jgi:hypothetical protein
MSARRDAHNISGETRRIETTRKTKTGWIILKRILAR